MGIVKGILRRERNVTAAAAIETNRPRADDPPPLMLMLPDASGVATYQLSTFPSSKAAEFYLDSTLRGSLPEGAVLFWALNWQPLLNPDYASPAEPLVIIRDVGKPVVYPFSFSDLESAHDFLRHEMNRGLDLGQAIVYWAVPARVEVDFWGRSTIVPPTPPARRAGAPARASQGVEEARTIDQADIAEVVDLVRDLTADIDPPRHRQERVVSLPRRSQRDAARAGRHVEPATDTDSVLDFPAATQRLRNRDAAVRTWGNFSLAVDEALDAYVARQVSAKLSWNRITRAIGDALRVQAEQSAAEEWPADNVIDGRAAWANAAAAMRQAVPAAREDRRLRRAWLNVSWTLEEAVYAYNLDRKARTTHGWRNAGIAIGEAIGARERATGAVRRAWANAGLGLNDAARAHQVRSKAFRATWEHTGGVLAAACLAHYRQVAIRTAFTNFGRAIGEAVEAHARREEMRESWISIASEMSSAALAQMRHEGMLVAWQNAGEAMHELCRAHVRRHKQAIRDWGRIARALKSALAAKVRLEGSIAAWANAGLALAEAVGEHRRLLGLATAWQNAGTAIAEAAIARIRHEILVAAWQTGSSAISDAVSAKRRHDGILASWAALTNAFDLAVAPFVARQAALESAWQAAASAITEAAVFKAFRESSIAAWGNAASAIGEAVHAYFVRLRATNAWVDGTRALAEAAPIYLWRMAMTDAWDAGSLALKEAVVAEAKVRIAQAGLNKTLMAEVDRAVRDAEKARKLAEKEAKKAAQLAQQAADEAVEQVGEIEDTSAECPTEPEPAVVFGNPIVASNGNGHSPLTNDDEATDAATTEGESAPSNPIGLWKPTARRWEPREEPFRGFDSPPGRFFRKEPKDGQDI